MQVRTPQDAGWEVDDSAQQAAERAGVRVAELSGPTEAPELAGLFMEIWATGFEHAPLSPDLLCALSFTGQYVATARRDGALVGGAVGFRCDEHGSPRLHSHITGVLPAAAGRQVGFALKLHQRAWARRHGLAGINWTFDPLVRRNAYFNLTKLGATATGYLLNAYGEMADPVNAGGPSDRLMVDWPVDDAPIQRIEPTTADADVVLSRAANGGPRLAKPAGALPRRIAWIPEDILALRASEPELALSWRHALRETVVAAMQEGFVARAMTRDGWYVLERRP